MFISQAKKKGKSPKAKAPRADKAEPPKARASKSAKPESDESKILAPNFQISTDFHLTSLPPEWNINENPLQKSKAGNRYSGYHAGDSHRAFWGDL